MGIFKFVALEGSGSKNIISSPFMVFSYLLLQSVSGTIVVCILQFYDMMIRNRAGLNLTIVPKTWELSVKVQEIHH